MIVPLYDYKCEDGHLDERYFHTSHQAVEHLPCRACGKPAEKLLSVGRGLCWFEEGRGQWIQNLGPEPVYVTSHEQHKRLMREHGVTYATKDDMLASKTRRALDARKESLSLREAFAKAKESL